MIETTVVVIEAMVAAMADAAFVFLVRQMGKGAKNEVIYTYLVAEVIGISAEVETAVIMPKPGQ